MTYDADSAPAAAAWLEAAEPERLAAIEAHHAELRTHPPTPKPRLHATLHLVVENQLAEGKPPEVSAAIERLVNGGLSRHDAVHAVAFVVSDLTTRALGGEKLGPSAYPEALANLQVPRKPAAG